MRTMTWLALLTAASMAGSGCGGPGEPATAPTKSPRETSADYDPEDLPPPDVVRFQVPTRGAPARGARQPLVTLVVFSDFQCPFCSRSAQVLERLLREHPDTLRIVFRHHPLPFHEHAMTAAEAAVEARTQGGDDAFWQMHDSLFARQNALTEDDLVRRARELGLDARAMREALADHRHRRTVRADQAIALGLDARGTPAHFVNGRPLMGAQPYHRFEEVLRQEIALARQMMQSGTPRGEIHAAIMRSAVPVRPVELAPPDAPAPAPQAGASGPVAVPVGDSPVRGPDDALVTIVEFADFECPFCGRAQPILRALREKHGEDLRIVFKHLPLPMHPNAMRAHEAAAEARAQRGDEGFWALHDRLFADIRKLGRQDLEAHAGALGLDMDRFRRALDGHVHRPAIERDLALARRVGVQGTPTFFINGEPMVGARPLPAFEARVERALQQARARVEQGVPREKVYERITAGPAG